MSSQQEFSTHPTALHLQQVLAVIFAEPGSVHEIRAPRPKHRGGTDSGYFDNAADALQATLAYCVPRNPIADAVYITPNPVDERLLARSINHMRRYAKETTADHDIRQRRFFCIDVDPIRPAGISATHEEHAVALAVTSEIIDFLGSFHGWPGPALAGTSGNGGVVWYRIDLPNDAEATALVRSCLGSLAALFDSDSVTVDTTVYNPARIMKLLGTPACKGDHLVGHGQPDRPWRWSTAHLALNPEAAMVTADQLAAVGAGL